MRAQRVAASLTTTTPTAATIAAPPSCCCPLSGPCRCCSAGALASALRPACARALCRWPQGLHAFSTRMEGAAPHRQVQDEPVRVPEGGGRCTAVLVGQQSELGGNTAVKWCLVLQCVERQTSFADILKWCKNVAPVEERCARPGRTEMTGACPLSHMTTGCPRLAQLSPSTALISVRCRYHPSEGTTLLGPLPSGGLHPARGL